MPLMAADPVIVSPEQCAAMDELVRAYSTPQQLALRARILLRAADLTPSRNLTNCAVARGRTATQCSIHPACDAKERNLDAERPYP